MFFCCKIFATRLYWKTSASELTLRSDYLDSRFQNHPESLILQKCQSLSNMSFKDNCNGAYAVFRFNPSFLLNLGCSSLTVTTQKAKACSPWTPCFFYKKLDAPSKMFDRVLNTPLLRMSLWSMKWKVCVRMQKYVQYTNSQIS